MSFEQNIKNWVIYDDQIKDANNKLKILREKKNSLTTDIFSYANENNLTSSMIKISDGKLKLTTIKAQMPLTYKFIQQCLNELISDQDKVNQIVEYIKQKRESKIVDEIRRTYNN